MTKSSPAMRRRSNGAVLRSGILLVSVLLLAGCMEQVELSPEVRGLIEEYGFPIRGYPHMAVLNNTSFYLNTGQSHMGMTIEPRKVYLSHEYWDRPYDRRAGLIFHELVHVVQIRDDSWADFLWTYAEQWADCGMSYECPKTTPGYEMEAYTYQAVFLINLGKAIAEES